MISLYAVKRFCSNYTEIENYNEAVSDKTHIYDCHHRREITEKKTKQQLVDEGLYYDRPPEELIFLTHEEHTRLHMDNITDKTRKKLSDALKGRNFTEEWKNKISESKTGLKNAMYGKCGELHHFYGKHHSEESKKKISEALKGKTHSEEWKKKMSDKMKGRVFTEEWKRKLSEAAKRRSLKKC